MEMVCTDNGPSKWMYDASAKKYHRLFANGDKRVIRGESLPDPFKLWEFRMKIMKGIPEAKEKSRPQSATFKLWEHWNVHSND